MASAAEADEGVARKKRVADRQITKDDNLAEEDSDGGSGEGGTWKKAPDDVMASRKIVKARRPGQAVAGAPAAAANPFANVKLVVPLPPPTVGAGGGEEKKPGAAAAAGDQVNVGAAAAAAAVKSAGEVVAAAADMGDGKGSNEMSIALRTEGKDGVAKTKGVKEVVEENGNQRHGNANGLEAGEKKDEGKTSANEGKAGAGRGEDTTKEGREEADDDDGEKEEEGESGESSRKDAQEVAGSAASAPPQAPPPQSSPSFLFASSFAASSPFFASASAGSSPAFAGFSFASSSAFGVAGQSFPPLSSMFGGKRDEQLPPPASSTPFSFFGPSSSAITTSGAPSSSSGGVGIGTGLLSSAGGAAGGGGAIVNLSEQHVETGEEEEANVFSGAAVLFEYMDGKSWKERGRGDLRLNVPKKESQRPRLVMRSKGNLRLLMNASIFPDMKVTKMDGRGVTFVCVNTAASGGAGAAKAGGLATYAVRLADSSLASSFLALMEENKLRAGNCPSLAPSGKRPLEKTEGAGGGEEEEQAGSKRPATEEKSSVGGGRVDVADDATKKIAAAAASAGTGSSVDDQKTREQEEQEEQQKEREKVTTDRADGDGGKGEEAV